MIARGAGLKHCVTQEDEGGAFVRINAKADYSGPVMEAMEWPEIHDKLKKGEMDGELSEGSLSIVSQQALLDGSFPELTLTFESIKNFKFARVKEKDQQSTHLELRFQIVSRDTHAAALCYEYKRAVKKSLGLLTLKSKAVVPGTKTGGGGDEGDEGEDDDQELQEVLPGAESVVTTANLPRRRNRRQQLQEAAADEPVTAEVE